MNRRSFFAVLSALVAIPAFVRAKVEDAQWQAEIDATPDVQPPGFDRTMRLVLLTAEGVFIQDGEYDGWAGREALVPVHERNGVMSSSRFLLNRIEGDTAFYVYSDGPKYWEKDFVHGGWSS